MPGTQPAIDNPTPPGGHLYANEAALPQGSAAGGGGIVSSSTFTVSAPDGLASLTVAGYEAVRGGVFTAGSANLGYGRLDVTGYNAATGAVSVTFTLTGPYQNFAGPTQRYGDVVSLAIVAVDADGDKATSTLQLQIRDDDRVDARADGAAATVGGSVTGNVLANDLGSADGGLSVTAIGDAARTTSDSSFDSAGRLQFQGQYGVLTVGAAGDFTYTANASAPAGVVDRFSYSVRDADGDQDADGIEISITAPPPVEPPPAARNEDDNLTGAHLMGGQGDDTLIAARAEESYLRGEDGDDRLFGGDLFDDLHGNMGDDTVRGGGGGDWVVGGKDQDLLFGDDGGDVVYGNLGEDTCEGGAGADVVRGGQGADVVHGGEGDDWLAGDRGSDTVTGGAGADVFHSFGEAGIDLITDFNRAEGDRIHLLGGSSYNVREDGGNVLVDIGSGAQVILQGVSMSSLTGDWLSVG